MGWIRHESIGQVHSTPTQPTQDEVDEMASLLINGNIWTLRRLLAMMNSTIPRKWATKHHSGTDLSFLIVAWGSFSTKKIILFENIIASHPHNDFSRYWRWLKASTFHPCSSRLGCLYEVDMYLALVVIQLRCATRRGWCQNIDDVYGNIQSSCVSESLFGSYTWWLDDVLQRHFIVVFQCMECFHHIDFSLPPFLACSSYYVIISVVVMFSSTTNSYHFKPSFKQAWFYQRMMYRTVYDVYNSTNLTVRSTDSFVSFESWSRVCLDWDRFPMISP